MKLAKLNGGPEIFHTIQGEGLSSGIPAVFIRASGCNLHCVWCDSDATWNFENTPWPHVKDANPGYAKYRKDDVVIELDPSEAAQAILAYHCPRVVITGGEPLLQQEDFLTLTSLIRAELPESVFEVETNATRIPSPDFLAAVDQFNVSPKLANAGMPESLRHNKEALAFFASLPKAWFKFVITSPADLLEVQTLHTRYQIPSDHIFLMPEGRSADDLDRTAPQLAAICRDLGFRFCDRLHIRLWGDRRGV